MFSKLLNLNPLLALGILMIVTVGLGSGGFLPFLKNEKLKPTPCRAALVKLKKALPGNWTMECNDNNLEVVINELQVAETEKEFRTALYRQLAFYMIEIAKYSQPDILEKVFIVVIKLKHAKLEINAVTEGKYIVKLTGMTSNQFIMDHLKQTVQVKEVVK